MPSAGALRAGRAVIELSLLTKPIEKGLRALQARTRAISGSFARIGQTGIGGGGGISGLRNLFVGSAASAALGWPIKMAANVELATAQMATFAGSSEIAGDMVQKLQKFAPVASQSFHELATQTRLLMSRGLGSGQALDSIMAIAAIAAGSTEEFEQLTKAFADVKGAGFLTGEEMRQFKNTAFNPYEEIAKRTGESFEQIKNRSEQGKVTFAEVSAALQASVRQGGRFYGLLNKIGDTLIGKSRRAWADFGLAIKQVGDAMLGPLKKAFDAINGLLPKFSEFIKANISLITTALGIGAAITTAVVAFASFGIALQILSIAGAGLAATFGLISAVLTGLFSLPGLLAASFAVLAYEFFATSEAGRQMVSDLAGWFSELAGIAQQTFSGIADALSAGDIQLAGQILWMGLKLSFLEGTKTLRDMWMDFKDMFIRTFIEASAGVQTAWIKMVANLKKVWLELKGWFLDGLDVIIAKLAGIGETEAVKKQLQDELVRKVGERMATRTTDLSGVDAERAAALAAVEANRATAQGTQDTEFTRQQKEAAAELHNLKKALQEATEQATFEAEQAKQNQKDWFGNAAGGEGLGGLLSSSAAAAMKQPEAFFDSALSRQITGGGVQEDQLKELKKIARNTAGGGGIPVT